MLLNWIKEYLFLRSETMSNFDIVYKNINGQPVPFVIEKKKTEIKAEPVKIRKKGGKKNV